MQRILLMSLVGALLGAGMAIAQSAAEFPKADSTPKKPSFVAKFDHQFNAADKNGDGGLSKAEAQAGDMGRVVEHFERLDGNRDGKVTRDEMRALIRHRLSS